MPDWLAGVDTDQQKIKRVGVRNKPMIFALLKIENCEVVVLSSVRHYNLPVLGVTCNGRVSTTASSGLASVGWNFSHQKITTRDEQ